MSSHAGQAFDCGCSHARISQQAFRHAHALLRSLGTGRTMLRRDYLRMHQLLGLSQIFASLTRENIAELEAAVHNLFWTQTEKDNVLARSRLSLRAWVHKKPMLCLHAPTDDEGRPIDDEDKSGRRLCAYWGRIFEARVNDERHNEYETILDYVQKAPEDIQWIKVKQELDEMLATEKESAPGPDGIPKSMYRCAGGLGSRFLFNACRFVVEEGSVPSRFAASRTVFIPKSSNVDVNGLIIRPPDALRSLTLCNCDCEITTTAICSCLHKYALRCIHPA